MGCGVWGVGYGVGCGVQGVECGVWGVGCGDDTALHNDVPRPGELLEHVSPHPLLVLGSQLPHKVVDFFVYYYYLNH